MEQSSKVDKQEARGIHRVHISTCHILKAAEVRPADAA